MEKHELHMSPPPIGRFMRRHVKKVDGWPDWGEWRKLAVLVYLHEERPFHDTRIALRSLFPLCKRSVSDNGKKRYGN